MAQSEDLKATSLARARQARGFGAIIVLSSAFAVLSLLAAAWFTFHERGSDIELNLALACAGVTALAGVAAAMNSYLRYGTPDAFAVAQRERLNAEAPDGQSETEDDGGPVEATARAPVAVIPSDVRSRLASEVRMQDYKANLNLIMGGVGALIAFAVLGFSVFSPPRETGLEFAAVAGARIMLSLTASVFAFFFLTTYRRNLSEIRYFHNELTNVQLRVMALDKFSEITFTDVGRSEAALLKMLSALVETERNFILKKGESTTDLYQKDLDRQEYGSALDLLKKVVREAQAAEATKGKT